MIHTVDENDVGSSKILAGPIATMIVITRSESLTMSK